MAEATRPAIPFFDYRPEYRRLKGEFDAAIARVLASGRLILGPEVRAFEDEFAQFVGVSHGIGVNSGTDALALALRSLDIGHGDEVITVANAGAPPVAAIRSVGAVPRFTDVLDGTWVMDPGGLDTLLTDRTRCILPVHLYGRPAPLGAILAFAERHGLAVVEDCAQAHGARYDERHVGTFGRIGCFSFYPTKNLGAFGDGGICLTDDPATADRLRALRMYGFGQDRHAHVEGVNTRLDEVQAAILRVKLAHFDESQKRRHEIAARYRQGLASTGLGLPPDCPEGQTHGYHLFVLSTTSREDTARRLEAARIGYGIHYENPVHRMEAYSFLGLPGGSLPVTETACASVLSLPLFPDLSAADVDSVIDCLASVR